jgi:hypothetical protein
MSRLTYLSFSAYGNGNGNAAKDANLTPQRRFLE